ncbi:hypothetical protein GQ54DRAFT_309267 [Martensiomyces pterosporus]|nr:hypothetical protein GQ54DRAFT_309267 [Martensiomyces pterosporus]
MHIFGSLKRTDSHETVSRTTPRFSTVLAPTDPFGHKSLRSSLSHSVKTLFSKRAPTPAAAKRQSTPSQLSAVRHMTSAPPCTAEAVHQQPAVGGGSAGISNNRYSMARARVLAETARRLQQGSNTSSPVTPSSISTGKTLPCFPEEPEHEGYGCRQSMTTEVTTEVSSISNAASCASEHTSRPSTTRSRATSVCGDMGAPSSNSSGTISFGASHSTASSSNSTLRPHSMINASRESLGQYSSTTSYAESTFSTTPRGPAQSASHDMSSSSSIFDHSYRDGKSGQRHSVAMSQNLSRRFQARLTHEYEQRIYCLHSHYSDVIERMEARAQQDSERVRKLEAELSEQRRANAELHMKEVELAHRLQQQQQQEMGWPLGGAAGGLSKKLVEFVDHYQEEVARLTRETSTAQEWVITLAELIIGPKKERQSWDDWLNLCLDTLQKRREQQKEEEWLRKIGWRG